MEAIAEDPSIILLSERKIIDTIPLDDPPSRSARPGPRPAALTGSDLLRQTVPGYHKAKTRAGAIACSEGAVQRTRKDGVRQDVSIDDRKLGRRKQRRWENGGGAVYHFD